MPKWNAADTVIFCEESVALSKKEEIQRGGAALGVAEGT